MADPTLHMHPLLGAIHYDIEEEFWLGTAQLSSFANYGVPVAEEFAQFDNETIRAEIAQFREGRFHVLVYTVGRNTPSAAQNEALSNLLENEDDICQAVLNELSVALEAESLSALRDQAWLRQVEIADEEHEGTAYAGFTFSTAVLEESPLCIIYHPEKGLWWAESSFFEALDLGLETGEG